ncbi:MAG TPA: hypothetical protein VGF92_05485 [Stellaceae bacterium]|jgi:hypothetical protein
MDGSDTSQQSDDSTPQEILGVFQGSVSTPLGPADAFSTLSVDPSVLAGNATAAGSAFASGALGQLTPFLPYLAIGTVVLVAVIALKG